MHDKYQYIETSVTKIGQVVGKLYDSLGKAESRRTRPAQSSFVMVAESRTDFDRVDGLIATFAKIHPSRFFVLYVDDALLDLKAEVSGTSHLTAGKEKVFSEVIRLGAPKSKLRALPNVVRANMHPGMTSELFVHSSAVDFDAIDLVAAFVDQVILDSSEFESSLDQLARFRSLCTNMLDLQWVNLGVWRDQLKGTFQRPAIRKLLPSVTEIAVEASSPRRDCQAACALLISGWILHAMGLEPVAVGSQGYDCRGPDGASLRLSIAMDHDSKESRLNRLVLSAPKGAVTLRRGALLETEVSDGSNFKESRPFDDESLEGLIRRYYLIGESTYNYEPALEMAQEMEQLRRGFALDG